MNRVLLPAAIVALGAGALALALTRPWAGELPDGPSRDAAPGEPALQPMVAPVTSDSGDEPVVLTNQKVPIPMHVTSRHPPGTYIPIRELPEVERGLELGDGTIVPYLNGMTWAPGIKRSADYGPVPPVVGKSVDGDGFEWYVHADGSTTTTRYQKVELPDETYWDPYTAHTVPTPQQFLRGAQEPDK